MSEYEVEIRPEVIEQISAIAANEAANVFNSLVADRNKEEQKKRHDAAYRVLKLYRRAKLIVSTQEKFSDEARAAIRWRFLQDLMGDSFHTAPERVIKQEEDRLETNQYCIDTIENAMSLYMSEVDKIDDEERKRAFRVMKRKFIDDEELTMAKIAEIEGITERTAYRDMHEGVEIMAIYMGVRVNAIV